MGEMSMDDIVFGELFEEKINEIHNAVDVITKFNLYRRGKLDISLCPEPKEIGDALDTLLGIAIEYEELACDNKVLKELLNQQKKKEEEDSKKEIEKVLQKAEEKKEEEKLEPINNRGRHNGENEDQCKGCENYDENGLCRWGECVWFTRKPMAFDFRVCCQTCSFYINDKCTYLKEQDRYINCKNKKGNVNG